MLVIPKRITLVSQVADGLRQGIRSQEWIDRLPAEAALALDFRVSRVTVRAAIKILRHEGLLEVSNGRLAQIKSRRVGARSHRQPTVAVIFPTFPQITDYAVYYNLYCESLHHFGFQTKLFSGPRFYRQPFHGLKNLISSTNADLWMVAGSSVQMQRWFTRHKIPVILDGSCLAETPLPALDVDNRATLRHAVGALAGLGHRQITYVTVNSSQGGDLASIKGFEEGLKQIPGAQPQAAIVYCRESAEDIRLALERVFASKTQPTAIICGRLGITLQLLPFLAKRGLSVPRDLSLICRNDYSCLNLVLPSIARYSFRTDRYARHLARMTLKYFDQNLPARQQLIVPSFIKGNSIGPCPAAGFAARKN